MNLNSFSSISEKICAFVEFQVVDSEEVSGGSSPCGTIQCWNLYSYF